MELIQQWEVNPDYWELRGNRDLTNPRPRPGTKTRTKVNPTVVPRYGIEGHLGRPESTRYPLAAANHDRDSLSRKDRGTRTRTGLPTYIVISLNGQPIVEGLRTSRTT